MSTKKAISLVTDSLKRLKLCNMNKKSPLLRNLHHFNPYTGKVRSKRKDRMRNIFRVLEVMIPGVDADTFAWGNFYTTNDGTTDFYTRGIDYIIKQTGMNDTTIRRCLADLRNMGYLKADRMEGMGKNNEGKIRYYSLRTFTTRFFLDLGFKQSTLEGIKAWKKKRNEKEFYKKPMSDKCKIGFKRIKEAFKTISSTIAKSIPKASKQKVSPQNTSQLLQKAAHIAERNGRSPMDVYKELLANC